MSNRCPVCNKEITEHLGLIGTCGLLNDCRGLVKDVLECEVITQTSRYLSVRIPLEMWKRMESEVADGGYHQTQASKERF